MGYTGTVRGSAPCPPRIPTVGVVEWSLAGDAPSNARIVYTLNGAAGTLLNRGGEAPVKIGNAGYRTLLLGLTDFVLALPRVVLLLLLAALARPSALLVIAVLGLTGWMAIARLVHGEVRSLATRPFVEAAVAR